ncbi:MAG: hypothetical protein ACJA1R_001766 [Flavobacteriales bacterium]|jgi:hypothetical protein
MKRTQFLSILAGVSVLSFGALSGCDADEGAEGTTCAIDDDCVAPLTCGDANVCVSAAVQVACTEGGTECGAGEMCGTDGFCADSGMTACTDGTECADTEQCTDGFCESIPATPYLYVAIVSNVPAGSAEGIETNTPGPDVDAIQLIQGGVDNFAAVVEGSAQGETDADEGNNNADSSKVTGANDAIPAVDGSEDCNLDEAADGGTFFSMGGEGGFLIVSFAAGIEITTGDTLNVWELSDASCANVSTVRPDAFSVYVSNTTDVSGVATAADISAANGWQLVGASGGNGGIFSQTVTIAEM